MLKDLALLFLRLGSTAFGGPAAHIGMMEDEVVRRRRWMTREEFLDMMGSTNLIPGPNSTEMAIHIGRQQAGWLGLLVSGSCFILPASAITLGLAWAYVRFGSMPQVAGLLYGIKPVIIAVVIQALWGLTRTAVKTRFLALVLAACVSASLFGGNEILILLMAGIVCALLKWRRLVAAGRMFSLVPGIGLLGGSGMSAAVPAAASFGLIPLFLFFLKVGSVLFGSGYVLLAFLRGDLVQRWHWLSEAQLLDAVSAGQLTPGPVFTTATFIGYLLGSWPGAVLATLGIFLPSFVFVAASGPLIPRLRRSEVAGAFLDGVNAASLALMAVVTWALGRTALVDVPAVVLAAVSATLLLRFRVNSVWLVLGGAAVGYLLHG